MGKEHIGIRLKTIRKLLNFNQDAVAQKLDITKQTLSRYEKGTRYPDSQFLQKFGRLFQVNGNWLLYGTGDIFLKDSNFLEIGEDGVKELHYYLKKIEELFGDPGRFA